MQKNIIKVTIKLFKEVSAKIVLRSECKNLKYLMISEFPFRAYNIYGDLY